ncbi:MAG: ribosomal RNA small subunit methyltransferase A, partial [Synergistaceae bacterium]|nr:ribosomal RNA small subunit methyltransferase A [Synergistaceae bacterium]
MRDSKNVAPINKFRNKKRFGQNFLCDKNILREIAASAEIKGDVVLEIGPGQGVLTAELINAGCRY